MHPAQSNQKKNGFTLLELLLVISILLLITGAVIPSFSNYLSNQNLRQAQENLKSDLRTAQTNALTGVNPSPGTDIKYWGVRITQNSNRFEFVTSTDLNCSTANSVRNTDPLPANIRSKTATSCVFFDVNTGDATITGVSPVLCYENDGSGDFGVGLEIGSYGAISTLDNEPCT